MGYKAAKALNALLSKSNIEGENDGEKTCKICNSNNR